MSATTLTTSHHPELRERKMRQQRRLLEDGASLGHIDAYEDTVREQERAAIADALRNLVTNPSYSVGQYLTPEQAQRLADEIAPLAVVRS